MKPLICITTYYVKDSEMGASLQERARGVPGQDMAMCTMDYINAVKEAGGIPALFSPLADDDYITGIVDRCDGILFTGGLDINPFYYGEVPAEYCSQIIPERDEFEFKLLDRAVKEDKPILGICRGFQLINIYYGGSMYQDIKEIKEKRDNHFIANLPKWHYSHEVTIKKGSQIAAAYGSKLIKTNSFHHQLIRKTGDNLQPTAYAADSNIEGLENINKKFLVGIQWHPEMMFEKEKEHLKIFKYFINRSQENMLACKREATLQKIDKNGKIK